jgi:serine/threonine protein kinase
MAKQLVVIKGLERGRVIELANSEIIQLGCSQALPVENRFRDPNVARVHCEVQVEEGRVLLVDSGTSQGTYLNGKKIDKEELCAADVVRIGDTELKFLDGQVLAVAARPGTESSTVSSSTMLSADRLPELAGRTLAHFKLQVVIGSGHWGRVFKAVDKRSGGTVAVKVLRPEFTADADLVGQLGTALKAVAPLRHRNLLTHWGAGTAGRFAWIATDYVEGKSATQVMRRLRTSHQLDWRQAYTMGVHIGRALKAAHGYGLVHGNLTPNNLLMPDADEVAILGDLLQDHGLTTLLREPHGPIDERLDVIAYRSPERTADIADVDHRSDIYSLGACIYGLLTGRPPFEGYAGSEVVEKIRSQPPIAPRRIVSATPPPLETIILRAMAKRPEDRYPTAQALLQALENMGKKPEPLGENLDSL